MVPSSSSSSSPSDDDKLKIVRRESKRVKAIILKEEKLLCDKIMNWFEIAVALQLKNCDRDDIVSSVPILCV